MGKVNGLSSALSKKDQDSLPLALGKQPSVTPRTFPGALATSVSVLSDKTQTNTDETRCRSHIPGLLLRAAKSSRRTSCGREVLARKSGDSGLWGRGGLRVG